MTYLFTIGKCIQTFIGDILIEKIMRLYKNVHRKFLGEVDFKLSVSQEQSIYAALRNMFFAPNVKSDDLGDKIIGLINLITETKKDKFSYYDDNMYNLHIDDENHMTMDKHWDWGTSIAKKYFEFKNYYVVVSEE